MKDFTPTFLYIKQHSVTGLLYFGKTFGIHRKVDKYPGSGKYWSNHIRKHGKEHVITLWYCLFYDRDECKNFALSFSKLHNITESKAWANLKPETGEDGGAFNHTPESRLKISIASSSRIRTAEEKAKRKGKSQSLEHILKKAKSKSRQCTLDGITIYQSHKELVAIHGSGKNGTRSPNFRYL